MSQLPLCKKVIDSKENVFNHKLIKIGIFTFDSNVEGSNDVINLTAIKLNQCAQVFCHFQQGREVKTRFVPSGGPCRLKENYT